MLTVAVLVDESHSNLRVALPTREARRAAGRELRRTAPRSSHGEWKPPAGRTDPVTLVEQTNAGRVEHLAPIRVGRMAATPFAYFRGMAAGMAADLANTPRTGITTWICGDAHMSNFGLYASPERDLVFDLNDFDEAAPGPWEWDLKRLAASAVLAGRESGLADDIGRDAARWSVVAYLNVMNYLAGQPLLAVHQLTVDSDLLRRMASARPSGSADATGELRPVGKVDGSFLDELARSARKARTRTNDQALDRFTVSERDGTWRFDNRPPLLTRLDEDDAEALIDALQRYAAQSLSPERRELVQSYRVYDCGFKVVGVGSVGTRAYVALLMGAGSDDPLLLQIKEAGPSVLAPFTRGRRPRHHGKRVVDGQRRLQGVSDPLLGWTSMDGRDYYVRQLRDMKGSVELSRLDATGLRDYARLCGALLAKAHARAGDAAAIAGYLGKGNTFQRAIAEFAVSYADQVERDHGELTRAIAAGRIAAETGV
jgi:uncharacterized protein (DUF2252 family)